MKRTYKDQSPQALTRLFGSSFAQTIQSAPLQIWSQPIESAFGVHLVKVAKRRESRAPKFEDIRGDVIAKWTQEAIRADNARRLTELISAYEVKAEEP